jgi:type I restriction-modification system DNA methylase subunit
MGYVYEELLRRFSEQSGEEAGDHFTPREVIRLMVELLEIPIPTGISRSTTRCRHGRHVIGG